MVAKSRKFYEITATKEKVQSEQLDIDAIKVLLELLEKIWLDGDLKESMTEDEYLKFRKYLEEFLD